MTKPERPQQVNIVPGAPGFNLVWLCGHDNPEQLSFSRIPIIAWRITTFFDEDKDEDEDNDELSPKSPWKTFSMSSWTLPITPDEPVDFLVDHEWAVEYPNGACVIPQNCESFSDVNELLEHWKAEARAGRDYVRDPDGKIRKVSVQ